MGKLLGGRAALMGYELLKVYLSLPPTRQDLTQGQMTRRSNYSGGGLEEGDVRP